MAAVQSARRPVPWVRWTLPWLVIALVALFLATNRTRSINGSPFVAGAYTTQWSRNAEIDGPAGGRSYTSRQIRAIVSNDSYESIPKFSHYSDISAHFADARRIAAASAAAGHHIHILEYFNVAYWTDDQTTGWRPYTDTFQPSWLVHYSSGQVVPYYGIKRSAEGGDTPVGGILDLRNADLRAWMVRTMVSWMKQAPYSGIHLDSANPLIGSTERHPVGNGHETWNQLFCGPSTQDENDCAGVNEWNEGLLELFSAVHAALAPSGYEVDFNGIAPSDQRGPTRNLGMLSRADIANDEDFCYHATSNGKNITMSPMAQDIAILQQVAAQDKRIFEITNFQSENFREYGSYCLAGFLMGWEPDHAYWVYHRNYSDPLSGAYPYLPEQNLNLGDPVGSYSRQGTMLTRSFEHGVVAVNLGHSPVTFTAPTDLAEYSDGTLQRWVNSGQKVTMQGLTGLFFLSRSFLADLS